MISLMKTRSLYNYQHHTLFHKGGDSFASGSLSMPDHWSLEWSVLFPCKLCVFDIQHTGCSFTNLMNKLQCPLMKLYFHFWGWICVDLCSVVCSCVDVFINMWLLGWIFLQYPAYFGDLRWPRLVNHMLINHMSTLFIMSTIFLEESQLLLIRVLLCWWFKWLWCVPCRCCLVFKLWNKNCLLRFGIP